MSSDSSEKILVRAESLGKFYPALHTRNLLRYLFPFNLRSRDGDFWALRDVSFELEAGKVLGIIGRNGSGKSTLMQMVAGLLQPSTGTVEVEGKTAALLELGAGFNPDFTGRENVMLSGTIYGYTREEVEERFDRIVEFADIGAHLDHPVKTYSSGMFARLAFAVAIEVNPQLLLVDEILSVGDIGFQARCYRRIEKLKETGTSILFVSHDLSAVQMLCDEAILLERGRMMARGKPKDVTDTFLEMVSMQQQKLPGVLASEDVGAKVTFSDVALYDEDGRQTANPRAGEFHRVKAVLKTHVDIVHPVISVQLKTMMGFVVYDHSTLVANQPVRPLVKGDEVEIVCDLHLHICPGPFRLGLGVADMRGEMPVTLGGSEAIAFEAISDRRAYGLANLDATIHIDYVQ